MRRMMHAALLLLTLPSFVNAQNSSSPYNVGDQSLLVHADESARSLPVATQEAPSLTIQPYVAPPNFLRAGCNRPNSQLAVAMNCNDSCPNLWENYASERAALAAKICSHINGQCGCFNGSHGLHSQACGPCGNACGESGCGGKASGLGKRNRYREPFSALYPTPSTQCGRNCLSKHACHAGNHVTESTCSGCPTCQGQSTETFTHPSSAVRPASPTRLANPPRNRLAEPSSDNIRAAAPYYRGPESRR